MHEEFKGIGLSSASKTSIVCPCRKFLTMATVKDVRAQDFIKAYAAHLKRSEKLQVPEWVDIVKTGTHKELPPTDPDWFYVRCASIARHIYMRPGCGVGALKTIHGGKVNRGMRPDRHRKASGSVNRKALQALEKMNILEQIENGGRKVTTNGQRDLDTIASICVGKRQ